MRAVFAWIDRAPWPMILSLLIAVLLVSEILLRRRP